MSRRSKSDLEVENMGTIDENKKFEDDYFRTPGIVWLVLIPLGLALLTMSVYCPENIPYTYLGHFGTLITYLVKHHSSFLKGLFYMTWMIHVGEAVYAYKTARSKSIASIHAFMWAIQTFLFGIASLKYLIVYKPRYLKKT